MNTATETAPGGGEQELNAKGACHDRSGLLVAVELNGRHKERQHTPLDAVFALANVDVKDGAVIVAHACDRDESDDKRSPSEGV